MALKGTLKDFGIADIFQLIAQQQKVGVLHLAEGEQEVHVAFKDGNVVRAESALRKKRELLGDMLVRAGIITPQQLEEALEEQKRTLKRLGDILVASGAATRQALRETTQLQTTETLYKLFVWKSGRYEFEATEVELDPEGAAPIRSESLLMEGFRRVDEWPLIRKKITSPAMAFERLKPLAEASGQGAEAQGAGPNEQQVFRLAEPGRDVQFVVDRSRLGEFEACKALLNLVNLGWLKPVPPPVFSRAESEPARRLWTDRLARAAGQVAMTWVLLCALAMILTRVDLRALRLWGPGERALEDSAVQRLVGRWQRSRIESALGAYRAVHGEVPEDLQELVSRGILAPSDLRYPWRERYYYRKTGEGTYLLLPPLP